MPWVRKGATKCMGCGKKTEPIDTATNSATLEMGGTHWQLTVDDQGNAVWTAARSAGAEGPDTDRARDLKLSASVDVSELATRRSSMNFKVGPLTEEVMGACS